MRFPKYVMRWILPALLICGSGLGFAQGTNSGDIRGSVTDATGALIPKVKVTVLNVETGVSKELVTNQDGLYDTSSIVAGSYEVTFTKQGFGTLARGPITLQVGITTVNAVMKVGSASEQVTVTTDVPLLQTESSEQTTTWDAKTIDEMPQVAGGNGQDWENLMIMLPGMAGTSSVSTANGIQQWGASNGNLPYSNILEDGASTSLGGSMIGSPAVLETVGELQISLSNFSALYGTGGMIVNQITKGGTSKFHGSAYDYMQNDALNATQYGFASKPTVPFERYHNFGGSVGGPILKKKMFFFFDYDQILNHGSASNGTYTVPTPDIMAGNFDTAGITALIYDPTTQVIATDSQGNLYPQRKSFLEEYGRNAIPSNMFDSVANKVQQYFPTPTNHFSGSKFVTPGEGAYGVPINNFYSTLPQSTPYRKYFGRLDYDIFSNNRLSMSDTQNDTPVIYPSSLTDCPLSCEAGDVDNNNAQITDVWTITPHLINEARMGYTWQGNFFDDLSLNQGYAAKTGWQFGKTDDFPQINTNNWSLPGPTTNATESEHVFDPSDVLTLISGKHILHFGGELLMYREDSTQWGNEVAGSMGFGGAYTTHWSLDSNGVAQPDSGTGFDYADFLLGTAANWWAEVQPEYGGRLKSPQVFVQDDYKLRPNLTVNLGLRYQITHGWNEVHGNEDSFDATVMNPATNTLGAMWYGSTHANGRTSLLANTFDTFLPRVGFSWLPEPNTTVRGGFGVYSYNWTLDTYGTMEPGGIGGPFGSLGSLRDPSNGIVPLTQLDGNGTMYAKPAVGQQGFVSTATPLPYTAFATTPDAYNGQGVGFYQYHAPVPKIYQWNLATQRMLSQNLMAEVAYVGSHGFNLSYGTDLNQVPAGHLSPSDSQYLPYPNYQNVSGSTNNGWSNYNSLQASITKRMNNGLSFSANYVWSHFLDTQDSGGIPRKTGARTFQIANDPAADYSNSNFDVRNAVKGYALYQLPFGKDKMFLNKNTVLDEVIGGWQITGTVVLSSGNPFSVYGDQNTYAQAGTSYPNWSGTSWKVHNPGIHQWFNPQAFTKPANGTFGNVRRNSLYGPGFSQVNLSGGKTFSLPWEGIKLQFRCDATNALNHPSWGVPAQWLSFTPGSANQSAGDPYTYVPSPYQITWATISGRYLQLGAHLTF
jgi:hypothetical protein